jgi:hypothetical protein
VLVSPKVLNRGIGSFSYFLFIDFLGLILKFGQFGKCGNLGDGFWFENLNFL